MKEYVLQSVYFSVVLTLVVYEGARFLAKKVKSPLCNPMLVAILVIAAILIGLGVDYTTYYANANIINYLMTPATVCLAIPLYRQFDQLRHHWRAILLGILSGVLASAGSIYATALLFGLDHQQYATLLPKSITAAIGMPLSTELGGIATITMAMITCTAVVGNVMAEKVCQWFRITEPVAKGVAIGNASHVLGTAKAIEMGEVEGAMSGLSLAVSGLLTVVVASVFANFL